MKIVRNAGSDRVVDLVRPLLQPGAQLDVVSPTISLFAFAELLDGFSRLARSRLLIPAEGSDLKWLGTAGDRAGRNRLQGRWLAGKLAAWIAERAEVKRAPGGIPQGAIVVRGQSGAPQLALLGSFGFSSDGLGLTPGNPLSLIQASETAGESAMLSQWVDAQWTALLSDTGGKNSVLGALTAISKHRAAAAAYALVLHHLFGARGDALDEEQIVKSATGIRNTVVWKKLYKFQRDGVVGAIDKLNRFGGCIIADSVGLGKTFEALAIIKYHELRNDRVLVLVPKRLRDNWTLYKANDRRNFLAPDRLNYDVLNHTDLGRDGGSSGDIDLAHVNWGNYPLCQDS